MNRALAVRRISPPRIAALASVLLALSCPTAVRADSFDDYTFVGSFQFPAGADVFDVFPDGRIIVLANANVYIESAAQTRSFGFHGIIPDAGDMQFPAFVRVSPDGSEIAVGDNGFPGRVGVFAVSTLTGTWFDASHFDAAWYDDELLAISGAGANGVSVLDTTSPDPQNPINPLVIDDTGFSGGIVFDSAGNLYTGNGFGEEPVETGDIRAFDNADWTAVLGGAPALDFLTDGVLIGDILSAGSLGFDADENLHVGGGDFVGGTDLNYAALVRASVVADALAGGAPADADDPTQVRRIDPDSGNPANFYLVGNNRVTGEIYVIEFAETTVYTYSTTEPVPAVGEWGVLAMALTLLSTATIVLRHRTCMLSVAQIPPLARGDKGGFSVPMCTSPNPSLIRRGAKLPTPNTSNRAIVDGPLLGGVNDSTSGGGNR